MSGPRLISSSNNVPSGSCRLNETPKGIWLDDNKIDGAANNVVAEAIDGSYGFKYLSLDGNDIGADGLEHLLGADVELRYLSIQECKLGNAGAVIAAKYIETSPFAKELKHLNFGFNKVTDKGVSWLTRRWEIQLQSLID